MLIKEVSDEVSIAQIIYTKGTIHIGDQLKEVPLLGMDITPYAHVIMGSLIDPNGSIIILPGLRWNLTRGVYKFKPIAGFEIPVGVPGMSFGVLHIPFSLYVGGEMDIYIRRLQLNPMVAIGLGGVVPTSFDDFSLSHLGLKANINITYLISRKLKIAVDAGFFIELTIL